MKTIYDGIYMGNDKDLKQADRERVLAYLKENYLAVVATVGKNEDQPEAATVHYFIDDDFTFYFITRYSTRKHGNLETNPKIAIVVGTVQAPHTVQMEGTAEILEDEKDIRMLGEKLESNPTIYQRMFAMVQRHPVFPGGQEPDTSIIKVTVRWLRWLEYDEHTMTEGYHQILP